MIRKEQVKIMSKGNCFELVKPASTKYVRELINKIIADQRTVDLNVAKNTR